MFDDGSSAGGRLLTPPESVLLFPAYRSHSSRFGGRHRFLYHPRRSEPQRAPTSPTNCRSMPMWDSSPQIETCPPIVGGHAPSPSVRAIPVPSQSDSPHLCRDPWPSGPSQNETPWTCVSLPVRPQVSCAQPLFAIALRPQPVIESTRVNIDVSRHPNPRPATRTSP